MSEDIRTKLLEERDEAPWSWVAPHFARGVLVLCTGDLDLVDAGVALATDDATKVAAWLQSGALVQATDEHAAAWAEVAPRFELVVVAPFVVAKVL